MRFDSDNLCGRVGRILLVRTSSAIIFPKKRSHTIEQKCDKSGQMPERSKGADLRSASASCVGSNPTLVMVGRFFSEVAQWYAR